MQQDEHTMMMRILEENAELLKENNKLLKRLHRASIIGLVTRILWYAFLIGLPFAFYFFLLEPYLAMFGGSAEELKEGLEQLPGVKGIDILLNQ